MSRLGPLLVVAALLPAAGQEATRLDRMAETQPGRLPPGWDVRAVSGQRLPSVWVEKASGQSALVMVADSAAGQAWLQLDDPLDSSAGTLSWEWSVVARPRGTDLRVAERDDAAARFFVVFGGGGLFGRPRLLFYTWGGAERPDDAFLSHVSDRVGVVVVRTDADALGERHVERRDLEMDFRRVFNRDPDEVRAVGIMVDTDQLGGTAELRLHEIRWEARAR